ncbi:DUF1295-domain-containing protein [Zopfia rhizophila CBS 207.26]|uniref:DUF1295-domain-containing protein n=1 Tax=Zopfia rhizophila CBS 207.26 TaxID=1314779 RepID=A0A6A6EU94_9PEZI|nr:DUF1295-domain-containing protein [Zopfia rhizophila CBS 207.26]
MTLLQTFLRTTSFRTPFLRTLIPSVALAYGIQTAVAIPSVAAQTERFYDLSGTLTYLSCTALSLLLPYLYAKSAGAITMGLKEYLSAPAPEQGCWWWRHVALSAAVGVWSVRLGSFLFKRIMINGTDSRFDTIRTSPPKFLAAFLAQATWVSLSLLPILTVNSLPRSAFALTQLQNVTSNILQAIPTRPYLTDVVGLAIFAFGLSFEVIADRQKAQWSQERREKKHSEEFLTRGLWSKSRHPNYFGEITLWSGLAIAAGGLLVRNSAHVRLGLSGLGGKIAVASMCAASPAFVALLLLKVSGVPLSEDKYEKRYGNRKDYQRWKENTPMLVPRLW